MCKETLQDLENLSNLNFLNSGVYDFMSVWSISHISFSSEQQFLILSKVLFVFSMSNKTQHTMFIPFLKTIGTVEPSQILSKDKKVEEYK